MKRSRKKKPQRRTISLTFKAAKPFNQLRQNHDTGLVEALMDGVVVEGGLTDVSTVVSYQRAKGPKVITKIPQESHRPLMTPHSYVEAFDVVFAIDTNSRLIRDEWYSVGAMAVLETLEIVKDLGGVTKKVVSSMNMFGALIHGKNLGENPEPWFWKIAIEEGIKLQYPKYNNELRVGLVVDSELGRLDQYNSGALPIFGDYYLPRNFRLVYASADTGSDFTLNKLLSLCDKEATLQLDHVQRGGIVKDVFTQLGGSTERVVPCTPYRFYEG